MGETPGQDFQVVTTAEHPELQDAAAAAFRERWPEFVFHDELVSRYISRVAVAFREFDILLLHAGEVAAGGWGVTFAWDGSFAGLPSGYRDALVTAVEDHEQGREVNALSFMAAAVAKDFDKQGLAARVLEALTARALAAGISYVVAPVRPTWKHRYPQVPMAEYATWARPDGLSIDPWIRTHQRLGATVLGPAPDSMVVTGTVAEWEAWADMPFPASGSYVVADALNLVEVDRERDLVTYHEENLWVLHR